MHTQAGLAALAYRPAVLIVEDDQRYCKHYRRILEERGFEVMIAAGVGEELVDDALRRAAEHHFALAIVDMRLGDGRDSGNTLGLDLVAALRRTVAFVITGYGDMASQNQALTRAGAYKFIAKDEWSTLKALLPEAHASTCLCSNRGKPHWHLVSQHTLDEVVAATTPEGAVTLADQLPQLSTDRVAVLLEQLAAFFRPLAHERLPFADPLAALYLPSTWQPPAHEAGTHIGELQLPAPLAWIARHQAASARAEATVTSCHRDLGLRTLLLDHRGDAWIGTMPHAGRHHSMADLAALSVELILHVTPGLPDLVLYDLAVALAAPEQLAQAPRPTHRILGSPPAARALRWTALLRRCAIEQKRVASQEEYCWALLLELGRRLLQLPLTAPAREPASLLAGVLCARLEMSLATHWPPAGWPAITTLPADTYRRQAVSQLFEAVLLGESRVVAGLGHMSGTPLLSHFVLRDDVRAEHLRGEAANTMLVYIDGRSMARIEELRFYELLLTSIAEAYSVFPDAHPPLVEELRQMRREAIREENALLAQRNLEFALALLCRPHGARAELRVGLVLDCFDAAYRHLSGQALSSLRALHDRLLGRLSFLLGLSDEIHRIQRPDQQLDAEPFNALFSLPAIWLPVDGEDEAHERLRYLEQRTSLGLAAEDRTWLLAHCGYHPTLLRAAIHTLLEQPLAERDPRRLSFADEAIHTALGHIWKSLDLEEQALAAALGRGASIPAAEPTAARMSRKGLLRHNALFSPWLKEYAATQRVIALLRIDQQQQVWRGAERISLSGQALTLLTYLYGRPGVLCKSEELLIVLFGPNHSRTAQALNELVNKIRDAIEPEKRNGEWQYLINVFGQGFFLQNTQPARQNE